MWRITDRWVFIAITFAFWLQQILKVPRVLFCAHNVLGFEVLLFHAWHALLKCFIFGTSERSLCKYLVHQIDYTLHCIAKLRLIMRIVVRYIFICGVSFSAIISREFAFSFCYVHAFYLVLRYSESFLVNWKQTAC